jgi:murein L,D-transpeptidase YcbB/YkuD
LSITARQAADLELLCTDAFLLYASHLLTGRVVPTSVTPSWNIEQRRADLLDVLEAAVAPGVSGPGASASTVDARSAHALGTALTSLRPSHPAYNALVQAYRRYRSLADRGGWPAVPDGPTLARDSTGERVALLRARLRAAGDLDAEEDTENAGVLGASRFPMTASSQPSDAPARGDSTPVTAPAVYDTALEAAVRRFQTRHGLAVDGAVGSATLTALNVPAAERAEQLALNLERWRWLPEDLGSRHILVNIADFSLRAVEDGADVLAMRVVTGTPYRQTPVFSGTITYLVLNPYWHVPSTIAVEDKLPAIRSDPGYLNRQQFEVFRGWRADAQPLDPASIAWDSVSARTFPYRLRQKPGPYNALGRVKFMFPNPHSVYLHDTPTRGLFAQAERSFSSGCIRLERPQALAQYLLADHPQWSAERLASVFEQASGPEQTVVLPTPIPVHLQYWTAWTDADGTVHFRNDIYRRDAALREALAARPPRPDQ